MTVELGDIITIDDISMTCVQERKTFLGTSYMFIYFSCGDLKEVCFSTGELDALGAVKREKPKPQPPTMPPKMPPRFYDSLAERPATNKEMEDRKAQWCWACATTCADKGKDLFCICEHFAKKCENDEPADFDDMQVPF